MANRRALCVGVNVFKNLPDATLQGCVNDARDMAQFLKDTLAFTDADITILTDAQATKAAIMGALRARVAEAKAGKLDHLVFSFSSHGTQVPDANGDEKDKRDEAFCPHDIATKAGAWNPATIITDDEFHDVFVQLPESTLLEVYLDTCHSGTGLRGGDPEALASPHRPVPRWLPPPQALPAGPAGDAIRGFDFARGATGGPRPRNRILWTGCRANQTSADAVFGGRYNGAFTYTFLKTLRESAKPLTRAQVRDQVRAALAAAGFRQVPQLETNPLDGDREIGL